MLENRPFVLIEVSRGKNEPLQTIRSLARESGATHPILWDENCVNGERYDIQSYPVSYLIGPDGRVFWEGNPMRTLGRPHEASELEKLIKDQLSRCPEPTATVPR